MILSALPCASQEMLGCGTCGSLETRGLNNCFLGGDNVTIACDMESGIVRLINLCNYTFCIAKMNRY